MLARGSGLKLEALGEVFEAVMRRGLAAMGFGGELDGGRGLSCGMAHRVRMAVGNGALSGRKPVGCP